MAENLVIAAGDARVRNEESSEPLWLTAPVEVREPLGEQLVQGFSRLAGLVSFVAALGTIAYWLAR